ncbi:hypothetical protein [Halonatronum saccharophilum]|uniref:hypothetical protein n=1 Tax=Halonatronum saccharophilum TaxID=150060 RepID=UPI0004B00108|nr:hypothetical protein [Halonatronum saccharophilum]
MSIISYILITIPEILITSFIGLQLVGVKGRFGDYLKIALLYTFGLWLTREVFNLYGLHFLLVLAILVLVFKFILRINWLLSFLATIIGFMILGISETITFNLASGLLELTFDEIRSNTFLFYLLAYLSQAFLVVIGGIIYRYNYRLIDSSTVKSP